METPMAIIIFININVMARNMIISKSEHGKRRKFFLDTYLSIFIAFYDVKGLDFPSCFFSHVLMILLSFLHYYLMFIGISFIHLLLLYIRISFIYLYPYRLLAKRNHILLPKFSIAHCTIQAYFVEKYLFFLNLVWK